METKMDPPPYIYNGARVLVHLHEVHLRSFVETWVAAKRTGAALPPTDDPSYASIDALLQHVLRAARGYMVWMCEHLELPDPGIEATPDPEKLASDPRPYMNHVLDGWRNPLKDVDEERFHRPEHPSRWKVLYCIDAMLEHAVMHPIRHEFQLKRLMEPGNT
jgi:hypothetical protein